MLYHNLISLECHPQTVLTKEGLVHRKIEAHAPRSIVDTTKSEDLVSFRGRVQPISTLCLLSFNFPFLALH